VLRRELATDTAALKPVLREALGLLMADGKSTVVRLNPSDRDTLANVGPNELASLALTLVADPSITPGGCVIESAGTVVDATVQKRWLRAIGTLGLTMPWDTLHEPA
jgi:flagellar assembly protein FliH